MVAGQLIVMKGRPEHLEQVFLIPQQEPRLLGRSSSAHFRLNDGLISSLHCEFYYKNGKVLVRDLLSANGVLVDNELVDERALQEGNKVKVGKTVLYFSTEQDQQQGKKYIAGDQIDWDFAEDDDEDKMNATNEGEEDDKIALGRLFTDSSDLNICRIAIKNFLINHQQVREALETQKARASETSSPVNVSQILIEQGDLQKEDIEKLFLEHKYYKVRNKDLQFAKALIQNKILPEEKIQECLSLQEEYFQKSQQLSRLGEILVQKGYLTVKENNRLLKSWLKNRSLETL